MIQGTKARRTRGRGARRPQQNSGNRSYDSNGPEIRVRGTAAQVYEKYQSLARDALSGGDRVMAENYQQHGEHYYRLLQNQAPPSDAGSERVGADGPVNGRPADSASEREPRNGRAPVRESAPDDVAWDDGDADPAEADSDDDGDEDLRKTAGA